MAFGDIIQKAVYLGIGLASYAGENLHDLRDQAQKLADEMVERGKMNAEEARRYVDELVQQAQQEINQSPNTPPTPHNEPRRIEIIEDETSEDANAEDVDRLRKQVEALQEELRKMKKN